MIDPTFMNINRLFDLSFKNSDNDPKRYYFKYQMPLIEIKDFNTLIDNKPFVNNKQEAYEKLIEMSINDDHTAENLLDFLYH